MITLLYNKRISGSTSAFKNIAELSSNIAFKFTDHRWFRSKGVGGVVVRLQVRYLSRAIRW